MAASGQKRTCQLLNASNRAPVYAATPRDREHAKETSRTSCFDFQDMGVDRRRAHVTVAQQPLHGEDDRHEGVGGTGRG